MGACVCRYPGLVDVRLHFLRGGLDVAPEFCRFEFGKSQQPLQLTELVVYRA